jgi:hypothetical protein
MSSFIRMNLTCAAQDAAYTLNVGLSRRFHRAMALSCLKERQANWDKLTFVLAPLTERERGLSSARKCAPNRVGCTLRPSPPACVRCEPATGRLIAPLDRGQKARSSLMICHAATGRRGRVS